MQPFSEYLRRGLHLNLDADNQQDCFFLFLQCWEVALYNSRAFAAMQSWINIEGLLRTISDAEWKASAAVAWWQYTEAKRAEVFECSCGRMKGEDLLKYFEEEYI